MTFRLVRWIVPALALLAVAPLSAAEKLAVNEPTASEARLKKDVTYLASDELEGRGVTTKGINLAADYMTDREPILRLRHAITNTNYYVHVYTPRGPGDRSLRQAVPLAARDLLWVRTATLGELPLTGLARKILERLDVMALRPVRVLPAEEPILPPPTRTRRSAPIDWDDDPETF